MEVGGGEAIENAVAVIQSGGYEGVNECFCSGGGESRSKACNVTEVEERYFGDVHDVGFERESGIQDDSKVLDQGEGVTVCPSMHSDKSLVEWRRDLGQIMMFSDLLQWCLRKLLFIQV